jgi:hypothetical protein
MYIYIHAYIHLYTYIHIPALVWAVRGESRGALGHGHGLGHSPENFVQGDPLALSNLQLHPSRRQRLRLAKLILNYTSRRASPWSIWSPVSVTSSYIVSHHHT